jgi:cell division septation protein DedD
MASKEKKNGGDFVLESRHLVGLFMLLVVIFGVVFTLGYLLGRSQYDIRLRAAVGKPPDEEPAASVTPAKSKNKPQIVEAAPPQTGSDWDFYHSAEPKPTEDHLQPVKKTVAAAQPPAAPKPVAVPAKATKPAKSSSPANAPLIPEGAIMLQVAAVTSQEDALALAQALQQKKFPAFVITPSTDKFYRVQVGPYADNHAAGAARQDLEAKGFKSIVKR